MFLGPQIFPLGVWASFTGMTARVMNALHNYAHNRHETDVGAISMATAALTPHGHRHSFLVGHSAAGKPMTGGEFLCSDNPRRYRFKGNALDAT